MTVAWLHKAFDLYTREDMQCWKAKQRRDRLKAAGLCINGQAHGPATHGVLCAKCRETHRRTA